MTLPSIVQLHASDNVVVAVNEIAAGQTIQAAQGDVIAGERIPPGHKVAVVAIAAGEAVCKYGSSIGRASTDIAAGAHVHSHNLQHLHELITQVNATDPPPPPVPIERTFMGYQRPSGRVGTRNYVAVISNVNCSASVSRYVARHFDGDALADFSHVDGVFAATHQTGCGMAYGSLKHEMLSRVLVGLARHPNVAACVMIGLGCEQGSIGYLVDQHKVVPLRSPEGVDLTGGESTPIPVIMMQDEGGTQRSIKRAIEMVDQLLPLANENRRSQVSAKHLVVGLECGGSDGYSGITANPAIGYASDRIVAAGGTAILSETSEIYGAEHLLVQRSRSPQVALALIERLQWWKQYVGMYGLELDNNPSVGNKAGGLTTIAEKSLGAVAKAGTSALEAVYQYAQAVTQSGLVVMDTPGFDPASVTGMVAGGANVVLFATGRGSCFGCKPTPSIKIASNSEMYGRLIDDMDFNAGVIVEGTSLEAAGSQIFDMTLDVASGTPTKSEQQGLGDYEFSPWVVGPTL